MSFRRRTLAFALVTAMSCAADGEPSRDLGAATNSGAPDAGEGSDGGAADHGRDAGREGCRPSPWPPESVADDGYQRVALCGWTLYLSDALFADALGEEVYAAMAEDLAYVEAALPGSALARIRGVPFWMELDQSDFPGGVYHPSAEWLGSNGYPMKWARGIQFGVARNYLAWVAQQPSMVLHELTHAFEHQVHRFAHPAIEAAYAAAMAEGLYDEVAYVSGGTQEAYATTNAREYFAELSEAYFASEGEAPSFRNDFFPFVRAELEAHDPAGFAAVEEAWGLR